MKTKILLGVVLVNFMCVGIYLALKPSTVEAGNTKVQAKVQQQQQQISTDPGAKLDVIRQREESLRSREMELKELEKQLEEKIKKLEVIEASVKNELQAYKIASDERIKQLVKIYSSMKPKAAASLMNNLDSDVAVRVLIYMKGDIAGSILSYMDTQKAASITQRLVSYRGGVATASSESAAAEK
jgi:flagellar motility protein MotE (MotC chaperone)